MRLPEQKVWDGLRRAKLGVNSVKLSRVENATEDGMPDVHGGNRNGVEFWIELKAIPKLPVRGNTLVIKSALRPAQIAWAKDWAQFGILSFVLAKIEDKAYLFRGPTADAITKDSFPLESLACGFVDIVQYLANLENKP